MIQFNGLEYLNTLELITQFQNGKTPENIREQAFAVLCTRFRERVLNKCEVICNQFGHNEVVAEIISERTFYKFAKKPGFNFEKSSVKNIDLAFELYLLGISKRELTNYFREEKRKKDGYIYDGNEKVITELPQDLEISDVDTHIIHLAIMSLPQSHRTVYLTYKTYERVGFNLPNSLRSKLREHLGGIKQSTIRTYKKEAIDRINAYVEAMKATKTYIK